jgi:hypothetical protein
MTANGKVASNRHRFVLRIEPHLGLDGAAALVAFHFWGAERVAVVADTNPVSSGSHFRERIFTVVAGGHSPYGFPACKKLQLESGNRYSYWVLQHASQLLGVEQPKLV